LAVAFEGLPALHVGQLGGRGVGLARSHAAHYAR
jgi:hypothetical protein